MKEKGGKTAFWFKQEIFLHSREMLRQARRCFSSSAILRKTLVLAEHNNSTLNDGTLAAISAASKLGEVNVLGMASPFFPCSALLERLRPNSFKCTNPHIHAFV